MKQGEIQKLLRSNNLPSDLLLDGQRCKTKPEWRCKTHELEITCLEEEIIILKINLKRIAEFRKKSNEKLQRNQTSTFRKAKMPRP